MALPEEVPVAAESASEAKAAPEAFDYGKYGARVEKRGRGRSGFIDVLPFQQGLSERAFRKFQQLIPEVTKYVNHHIVLFDTGDAPDEHHERRERRAQAAKDLGVSSTPLEQNRMRLSSGLTGSLMVSDRLLQFLREDPETPIGTALAERIEAVMKELEPYNTFGERFINMRSKDTEAAKVAWVERITDRLEAILDLAERPSQHTS